jgi:hypothetical protein
MSPAQYIGLGLHELGDAAIFDHACVFWVAMY